MQYPVLTLKNENRDFFCYSGRQVVVSDVCYIFIEGKVQFY
jgi:hypothetical protein